MSEEQVEKATASGGEEVAVVLGTKLGLVLAGLLTQSLLAYGLLTEGRGAYAVCVMFGLIGGVLFAPGADRGTQYFVAARRMSVSEGVSVALLLCSIGSLLAALLSLPLIHSDVAFFQKAERESFYFALALIPMTSFSTACQLQLAGLRRFGRLALFTLIQAIVNVSLIFTLVWVFDLGVVGAIVALAVSQATMIAACLIDLRRHYGLRLQVPTLAAVGVVLGYGLKYYAARAGNLVDLQIGAMYLAFVASRTEIGLFTAAAALTVRSFLISDAIESSLLPRVAGSESGRPDLVALCARISGWLTGTALLGLVLISEPLVRVLLSAEFLPSVPLIWAMAPGVFLYSGAKVIMTYFRGINRPGLCSWAVWLGLATNLTTLWFLYPELGVVAAAIAMSVGFFFRSLFLGIAYRSVSDVGLGVTWLPRSSDAAFLFSSGRRLLSRVLPSGSQT